MVSESDVANERRLIKRDIARQNAVLARMSAQQRETAKRSASLWTADDWADYMKLWNEMYES